MGLMVIHSSKAGDYARSWLAFLCPEETHGRSPRLRFRCNLGGDSWQAIAGDLAIPYGTAKICCQTL